MSTLRYMNCCCCGAYAGRWQQHWNRDTGFGVCVSCVESERKHGASEEEIASYYGVEGVNWGKPKDERETRAQS